MTAQWEKEGHESYVAWQAATYSGMKLPEESEKEFWERYYRQFPEHR